MRLCHIYFCRKHHTYTSKEVVPLTFDPLFPSPFAGLPQRRLGGSCRQWEVLWSAPLWSGCRVRWSQQRRAWRCEALPSWLSLVPVAPTGLWPPSPTWWWNLAHPNAARPPRFQSCERHFTGGNVLASFFDHYFMNTCVNINRRSSGAPARDVRPRLRSAEIVAGITSSIYCCFWKPITGHNSLKKNCAST